MLERLTASPLTVSALAEPLDMSLAAVVQHLQILEQSGLVRTEKVGRVRTCSLVPGGLTPVEEWIRDRRNLWERRLDGLAALFDEGRS